MEDGGYNERCEDKCQGVMRIWTPPNTQNSTTNDSKNLSWKTLIPY